MSVDLDTLEAFYSSIDFDRSPQVVAVVQELRAAREVVEVARQHECFDSYPLAFAVEVYDEVTKP